MSKKSKKFAPRGEGAEEHRAREDARAREMEGGRRMVSNLTLFPSAVAREAAQVRDHREEERPPRRASKKRH